MVEKKPIGSLGSFFKGFLGGSLLGSGIFSLEFGGGIQATIFLIGLLILIDSIMSRTEEIYPMSMFLGAVVSFFLALFLVMGKLSAYWTGIILALAALVYLERLVRRLKGG